MATLLQKAIELAVRAHRKGEDPPGEPYVVHPMRVLLAVSQEADADQDERLRCVAVLHDVLERGGLTAADLRSAGMPRGGAGRRAADPPPRRQLRRLRRAAEAEPAGRAVKLADLLDNADLRRVTFRPGKAAKDVPRLVRYAASYKYLTGQITRREYRGLMRRGE